MFHELRYALRVLANDFGFAAVAVLTLALGIGANTAIFTIVNAVLLRPLPYNQPDRLVSLYLGYSNVPGHGSFSLIRLDQLRSENQSFSNVAGFCSETFNLTGVDQPEQLRAARVSHDFLRTLGVQPILGRSFLPEEDREGGRPVVLLSYGLWQRRFAGKPDIVGSAITLDSTPYTVIGVLPPGLDQPSPRLDLLATNLAGFSRFTRDQITNGGGYINGIARLRPESTLPAAQSEIDVLSRRYLQQNVGKIDAAPNGRMGLEPLQETLVSDIKPALLVLSAAVGALLLIACANVASLLLARATSRRKEFAVRAALGASRRDLVCHLLAESFVLALAGGALGTLIAFAGVRLVATSSFLDVPRAQEIQLDWQTLAFTLAVSILTGVVFGLIPAFQVSKPDLNSILRESGRGAAGSVNRQRVRTVLVIGQVGVSMLLLIAASLLIRSFIELQRVDPGFDPRNVLTMRVSLPAAKYGTNSQKNIFFRQATEKLEAIPGVRSASAVLALPLESHVMAPVQIVGAPPLPFNQRPVINWQSITPDYFQTMGIRLVRGRFFTDRDNETAAGAAIVNESFARRFWSTGNPLGKHIRVARVELDGEVVGVVADAKTSRMESDPGGELYTPYAQRPWPAMSISVRTSGEPMAMASAVRKEIATLDPELPLTSIRPMEDILADSYGQRRWTLWLLCMFAAIAISLAAVGIYGLLAYSVEQRRQEMGIRRALGATPRDLISLVLREGLTLTGAGILVGLVGSLALTRALGTLLFHVSPIDPAIFAATALLFVAVALLASYLPARRAIRIDPLIAIRE
jgi:putative ABC transport system permease protein